MKTIAFIDTEIEPKSQMILDIGSIRGDGHSFHSNSVTDFLLLLKAHSSFADITSLIMI